MSSRRTDDQIEEIVAVDHGQPVEIFIENQNGAVVVRGTDRPDVLIRAEKHGNRASAVYQEAELRIETGRSRIVVRPVLPTQSQFGPSVKVDLGLDLGSDFIRDLLGSNHPDEDRAQRRQDRRERKKKRGFAVTWDNHNVSYEIEIEVPRTIESQLTVNTASGDVQLNDITGAIDLTTASGDANLVQLIGEIRYNTGSGDLQVQRSAGQIVGRSASGDARIEQSAFNALRFHSASGDLHMDAALTGDGPYVIETVSGDCQLAIMGLNPASGAPRALSVTFKTVSGHARLDDEFRRQRAGQWVTGAAESGPAITVTTVSGDLRGRLGASDGARSLALRSSGLPAPPAPPAAPAPPAPPAAPAAPAPVAPAAPPAPLVARDESGDLEAVHTGGLDAGTSAPSPAADRLALLEAVERGEIDIEEALQRLEDRKDAVPDTD